MSDLQGKFQKAIRLGTHGEDYGSWMSNPVFYMVGGLTALAALLAVLSFAVFHIFVPGILFARASESGAAASAAVTRMIDRNFMTVWVAGFNRLQSNVV